MATQLIKNKKYYVSIKAVLSNSYSYSSNNLGTLFTMSHLVDTIGLGYYVGNYMHNFAHIVTTEIIDNTENWTEISGSFIADSAYKYIVIGNFYSDSATVIFPEPNVYSVYYFIDDICVTDDSLGCDFTVNNSIFNFESNFNIYPTIVLDRLFIEKPTSTNKVYYSILSDIGLILEKGEFYEKVKETNLNYLLPGIYFISLYDENNFVTKKFLKL